MWSPETLVSELDHPDGRAELARRATALAQELFPRIDIEIFWDKMWIRRVGPHFFPDPDLFRAEGKKLNAWPAMGEKYLRDADDYWFHHYRPSPGDRIIDVGAGRGEDVFAFSKAVGPNGKVWAVEPHPVSFAVLERFCALNRLTNVVTLNRACTAQPGHLQVETLPVWESCYVRDGAPSPTSHPVEGVPLDQLFAAEETIDFLKMNIEGAERDALPGATNLLGRVRSVCVAAHDFRALRGEGDQFRTLGFVREFLSAAGFEIVTRDDDPRYYVPYHVHGFRP